MPEDANRIDVAALAHRVGLDFIEGTATAIQDRSVLLDNGTRQGFDLLSLNTGSEVDHQIGGDGTIWVVKPLDRLTLLRAALTEARATSPRIVIAGAGPTGTEVAANIAGLFERAGETARIDLIGQPKSGRGWRDVHRTLKDRGVTLLPDARVVERSHECAVLDNGISLRCDFLIAATGLKPNPLGAPVAATLRSLGDPAIFACGDCARFTPRPLPSLGVFGVREAPILTRNLIAAAFGQPLIRYQPQRNWLSILDLGNGEGFATWGRFSNRSRAALRLKRRLDLAFVRRFQV